MPDANLEPPDIEADIDLLRQALRELPNPVVRYCFTMVAESIARHIAEVLFREDCPEALNGLAMVAALSPARRRPRTGRAA
jgi:hypothetical protein